ncbi:unnamed protein product [Camellia sinensis]
MREETEKLCCRTSSELVGVDDGTVDSHWLAGEVCSNEAPRLKKEKKTTDLKDLLRFEREERREEMREETKKLCYRTSSELVGVDGVMDSH